jgi:acetyl esterase/lipase
VKARVYTPLGAGIAPGPGILFFHGGGFVIGDLESHDMLCKRLAEGSPVPGRLDRLPPGAGAQISRRA